MRTSSRIKTLITLSALSAAAMSGATAEEDAGTVSMLFIGNSFTQQHNIPDQVRDLLALGNPGMKVDTLRVIYGGSIAAEHWNHYRTVNILNLSDFTREDLEQQQAELTAEAAKVAIEQAEAGDEAIARRHARRVGHLQRAVTHHGAWMKLVDAPPKFDYVVLQSYRDEIGGLESSYANYARKFAEVIHDHGAKMVLYATAQREQNGQPLTELPDPQPVMEKAVYLAQLGNELDALVVPVSLAIHKLREQRLDLTTRFETDSHLNQVCAYLTLCCFYAAILDQSPVGLDYREINAWANQRKDPNGNLMHQVFDVPTATAIQQAAWDAVQEMKALQKGLAQ